MIYLSVSGSKYNWRKRKLTEELLLDLGEENVRVSLENRVYFSKSRQITSWMKIGNRWRKKDSFTAREFLFVFEGARYTVEFGEHRFVFERRPS